MLRIKHFLKPFILSIIAVLVLLFIQAFADLNLPNYMSNIVSTGIQQGGIEHASLEVISEEAFQFVYTLSTEENKNLLEESYTLNVSFSDEAYPEANSSVYVLNDVNSENRIVLDQIIGESLWTLINFAQAQGSTQTSSGMSMDNLDTTQLYAFSSQLAMMPETLLEPFKQSASEVSDLMKAQTGVVLAKSFLTELGADLEAIQMNYILKMGAYMILISLIGTLAVIFVGYFGAKMGAGVAKALRKSVFEKVESFSNEEFDHFSSSSLITRSTNDITQIQTLIAMGTRIFFYAPIMAIGGVYMITQTNLSMVWIIALAVSALIVLIAIVFTLAVPKFKLTQSLVDKLNLVARENLTGLMVVRAFANQSFEDQRFDAANKNLADVLLFVSRVMVTMMPFMMLIMNITIVAVVWFGAQQIDQSALQIGDMMAFMQYAMQVIMSFLMISMIFIIFPRAQVSANRIADVLETQNSIKDPQTSQAFVTSKEGVIEFKKVGFRYKNAKENVLENISFIAHPGQTTAIIGSTGSGKSTLINLIPRFYDVSEGVIEVCGVDVRNVSQHNLHEKISYIPQKGMLLSGSINFNLKYGKTDASDEDVLKASEIAQAMDFIDEKEDKFETHIAQAGANVSGGQKQRLSIARALVKKSPILIFDDSFSALDFKTDQKLRAALKKNLENTTILIVAQRVNTIMDADQIIVLDEGKMVGSGTHKELLKSCPTYFEIASSQLSAQELAR